MDASWPDKRTTEIVHDSYRHLENTDTWRNDPDDADHNDYEDSDEDEELDPVYVAHFLRQMGASWATSSQYATHRLIVSEENGMGYHFEYPGIAQFLIPASAVFRDFLTVDQEHIRGSHEHLPEEQRRRLSCLRYAGLPATPHGHPSTHPLPTWPPHHQGNLHKPQQVPNVGPSTEMLSFPVLELMIPYPEHFQPLLQAMYDLDLDTWAASFTPATIGPITANVSRLECSTDITLRCLEYYRQIRPQASDTIHRTVQGDREDLERLYQLAARGGLLSQNP
ncbi:MAG: hypothetical protein BYD32DRAFT_413926 [Podila humilis]|nr:MAG: hypothetical protein BYD32DRAFT_413926 [Podila humilis]